MKCSDDSCNEPAVCKAVHMGTKEVCYCTPHANKYKAIMEALGISPRFYSLTDEDHR